MAQSRSGKKLIGVQFSKSGISMVATNRGTSRLVVTAAGNVAMEDPGWLEHEDWSGARSELRKLVKRFRLRGRAAVLGVPNDKIILRYFHMPELPLKALRQAIQVELGTTIHLPFEDPVFDVIPVRRIEHSYDVERKQAVVLVAAPRRLVERMVQAAKYAGLKPTVVDVIPLALWRLAEQASVFQSTGQEPGGDGLTIVIDARQHALTLALFVDDTMYLVRDVENGLALDEEDSSLMTKVNDMGYELLRVVNFFNYNLSDTERPLKHVVLHCEAEEAVEIRDRLAERIEHEVLLLTPDVTWRAAAEAGLIHYPAMGLALNRQRGKT